MADGFAQIRNGLLEHIKAGKLSPADAGVYLYLHLACDYKTGIIHTTALGIAATGFGDAIYTDKVQESLSRLKKIRFINYPKGIGKRGGYDILIDKFEPKGGDWVGYRLNAWESKTSATPVYGRLTDAGRTGDGRSTDAGHIPYVKTGRREEVNTDRTASGATPDPAQSGTGETPPAKSKYQPTPINSFPVIPPKERKSKPTEPTQKPPTPPVEELADIRDWNREMFGVPAERLRNCLTYVMGYMEDDYFRKDPPTVASMEREKFVTLLNKRTPPGWTPENHGVHKSRIKPADAVETDADRETRERRAQVERIKTFRCTHCGKNGFNCKCYTNVAELAEYLKGTDGH